MRIPENVKVGGRTYTVKIIDRPLLSDGRSGAPLLGRIEYDEESITLSSYGITENAVFLTFLHELVHALTHERMIDWGEKDEEYTESLAKALHALFVDNAITFGKEAAV